MPAKKTKNKKVKKITKKTETKVETKVEKKKLDHETRQLIWVFIIILVLFGSFMIPYFYFQSLQKFEFLGVDWLIEKPAERGGVTFYSTILPKIYKGEFYGNHNVYLRNDPRKNKVPTDVNISFTSNVIIAHGKEVYSCPDQILVGSTLGQITALFPRIIQNVSGAISDKEIAETWEVPFADCSTATGDTTVFLVQKADKSSVKQDGNCYIINVANCDESLLSAERFVIEIIDQLNYSKK